MQSALDHSLARAFLGVHDIQQASDHLYECAQRARTKAHLARHTAQATREKCQQTRHMRIMIRKALHREAGSRRGSPKVHPHAECGATGADQEGTPLEIFPSIKILWYL